MATTLAERDAARAGLTLAQQAQFNDAISNGADIAAALARAAGTVSSPGASGIGATGSSGGSDPLSDFFAQTSGFSVKQLAESTREFNANLDLQREQMEKIGIPEVQIKQYLARLEDQKMQNDLEMARGQLGLDYLKTAAGMGGPADYFQQADFMRGAQQRGDVPLFLQALQRNTQMPAFQGVGSTPPAPQSPQGLAGSLTGASGGFGAPAGGVASGGAVGGAGGPTVTINGLPMSPGGGGGGPNGGSFAQFMSGGPASGAQVRYNAPGPNTPNDTQAGQRMGGTTGMFSGATQNFGYGPGQGSQSVSGQRGTNVVSYDPNTRQLLFDYNFLTSKPRAVFGLKDRTTGKFVYGADPSNVPLGGQQGGGGTGWMNFPYVSGASGRTGWTLGEDLDPSHTYEISTILPMEGGSTGDQPTFSGADILNRGGGGGSSGLGGQNAQADALLQNRLSSAYNQDLFKQLMSQPGASLDNAIAQASGGRFQNFGELQSGTSAAPAAAAPGTSPAGYNTDAALAQVGSIFKAGPTALKPGTLETYSPTELALLKSGGQKLGYDVDAWLDAYNKAGIGQSALAPR